LIALEPSFQVRYGGTWVEKYILSAVREEFQKDVRKEEGKDGQKLQTSALADGKESQGNESGSHSQQTGISTRSINDSSIPIANLTDLESKH